VSVKLQAHLTTNQKFFFSELATHLKWQFFLADFHSIFDYMNAVQQPYLSPFGEILLYLIGGLLFISVTLFVSKLVRPNRPNEQKLATYESGEEPISAAWTQFNVRFYIIALIFLLFEIEIIFLFPWATVFAKKELLEETYGRWGWFAVIEAVIFILVLALGLAYAWVNGFLDWIKPSPQPTEYKSPVPKSLYDTVNVKYDDTRNKRSS
jgi:NADH-quinone oxidoreductase subunit A